MKKFFVCMFVVALMVTSSTLRAQEAEPTPEAEVVEPVAETVVEQAESVLPVADAQPIASGVIFDSGVVAGGIVPDGQAIQAFDSSCCNSCCNSCCEESPFVQPVVFNQPVISSQPILPESFTSEPIPATFTFSPQPIAAECSSCSGAVANFAPAPAPVETFAPVATSFATPTVTQTFASVPAPAQTFTSAPAPAQTFVSAPVRPCVQATAPAACCQPTRSNRLFRQRGMFSRLRNSAISSAISNDN